MAKRRYPAPALEPQAGQLSIEWPDGHHSHYALADLRAACPCAECNAYRKNPDPLKVAPAASCQVRHMNYVGNYALQFEWEDGHHFGIYTWDRLRRLCACPVCRAATESE